MTRGGPGAGARARGRIDRYDLYELSAQSPVRTALLLRAIHGRGGAILGEDFCGSGAVSRAWVTAPDGLKRGATPRAVCVDKDAGALKALKKRCARSQLERLTIHRRDVMRERARVDVLAALNFPVGYWHDRGALIAYLRRARARLRPRGAIVVDTYGGESAMRVGRYRQRLPGGILYEWHQRETDPLTGRVRNAMHFRVDGRWRRGVFAYDWRLWSIAELKDAMREAGLRRVEVYDARARALDARGRTLAAPVRHADELDEDYVVYVVGRR